MAPRNNLSGQEFNGIKILEWVPAPEGKTGTFYKCICPYCKKEFINRGSDIKSGNIKSCGCWRAQNKYQQKSHADLLNKKFGKLLVLEKTELRNANKSVIWKCICDCGNICYRATSTLTNNSNGHCCDECNKSNLIFFKGKDITNKRFGYCVAIKSTEKRKYNSVVWECLCDCGKTFEAPLKRLTNGQVSSCGCKKVLSKGELKIKNLLDEYNIHYTQQQTFEDCRFPDTNHYGFFNFFIDNSYIVEYDGEQHYQEMRFGDSTEKLLKTQEHDIFKNKYCKEHNIPIIRIPYTHYSKLCIEDLKLKTSNFIIN